MSGKELARKQAVVLTGRMETEYMTCGEVVASGRYPYTGWLGIPGKEDLEKVDEALATGQWGRIKRTGFCCHQRWPASEDPSGQSHLPGTGADHLR